MEGAGAIATDRGSGTINAVGGTVVTYGYGSPGVYSTGNITVKDAKITAFCAEGGVIEGSNSIIFENSNVTSHKLCGAMIYQSFSGDAQGRRGVFSMKGGAFTVKTGPIFWVNNTNAVITLQGVKLASDSGVLLNAAAGRWGRKGSNGGHAALTAIEQTLEGNITCDSVSSASVVLKNHSTLNGAAKGASLTIDDTSTWNVTSDSALKGLTLAEKPADSAIKCIQGNGHTVEYDANAETNRWLGGKTYKLAKGGTLKPKKN